MRPQMVMLEVRPLDARKLPITKEPYKFPYIEIENLIFVRIPDNQMKTMQIDGSLNTLRDSLMEAAGASGVAWVKVPEIVSMLDHVMQEVQEMKPDELKQSNIMAKLAAVRDEILTHNHPVNKTFLLLPETVRFLEVKEKWETIPDQEPKPQ